jgi:hypothetical protein
MMYGRNDETYFDVTADQVGDKFGIRCGTCSATPNVIGKVMDLPSQIT